MSEDLFNKLKYKLGLIVYLIEGTVMLDRLFRVKVISDILYSNYRVKRARLHKTSILLVISITEIVANIICDHLLAKRTISPYKNRFLVDLYVLGSGWSPNILEIFII